MLDDRPFDDEYPRRNDEVEIVAYCFNDDMLEEIIRQGRIPCEEQQRRQDSER